MCFIMTTVIIFLIVLAVLIFVHELGHFLAARACGIRVDAFKIGFGPRIIHWRKNGTEYGVNLIPFGGYVKIFGENPDGGSLSGPDAKRSFVNKSRPKQAIVLVAGVFFNFLFAWLLYVGAFTGGVVATRDGFDGYASYLHDPRIMITFVEPGSPAERGGLKVGDVLNNVAGAAQPVEPRDAAKSPSTAIFDASVGDKRVALRSMTIQEIQDAINSSGNNPITIDYSRNNKLEIAQIVPVSGLVEGKYAIGIGMREVATLRLPFYISVWEGLKYTGMMIKETAVGLYMFIVSIFQGAADFSSVSGPVGIAGIVGSAAQLGFTYLLMITALVSINLGVINLIPFPALDGGRILFVAIESIIRRRVSPKISNIANGVGFAFLMALMVLVTYKDIAKMFE